MDSRKKMWILAMVLLAAGVLLLPGPARSEMYVEGYLGGVHGASGDVNISASGTGFLAAPLVWAETWKFSGRLDPAFQGGLKLGAWFDKTGVLSGVNFPAWMRYFGFYLDFSYHRLDFPRQQGVLSGVENGVPYVIKLNFWSEGYAATLAFMFAARYGFLPDKEVPFGRLQPYVAIGPAIMFTGQTPSFQWLFPGGPTVKLPSDSEATICLAVEGGIRWMALKNVSIDVSFKYRYAQPRFRYTAPGDAIYSSYPVVINQPFHLFSYQVGAAYHF